MIEPSRCLTVPVKLHLCCHMRKTQEKLTPENAKINGRGGRLTSEVTKAFVAVVGWFVSGARLYRLRKIRRQNAIKEPLNERWAKARETLTKRAKIY